MKRVVIASDLHCGSEVGLTHPDFQTMPIQAELWDAFLGMMLPLQPIDILIVNGDLIDGKAYKAGGGRMITVDRAEQAEMAAQAIEVFDAKEIFLTYGSAYHGGQSEDWEGVVADKIGAPIEDQLWLEVYNTTFDVKHFVGASSIPHGRHTTIARDRLWNILWADMGQQPKSDVLIRSHVHYHNYNGGPTWVAMTTPALQGLGCKFGSRIPSGIVDYGLVHFDVDEDGFTWDSDVILIDSQVATTYVAEV